MVLNKHQKTEKEGQSIGSKKTLFKKVAYACGVVFKLLIVVLGILIITITLAGTKTDTGVDLFGYSFMNVLSGSMDGEPTDYEIDTIATGSLVIMKAVPTDEDELQTFLASLEVGDVITFISIDGASIGELVTHRIIDVSSGVVDGELLYVFTTQGDANPDSVTETVTISTIKGQIVGVSDSLGFVYNTFMNSTAILFIVVIPAAILFIIELIRLILLIQNNRNEKQKEKTNSELEELKRQVELLQQSSVEEIQKVEVNIADTEEIIEDKVVSSEEIVEATEEIKETEE
ncbi:MAG: hypothetical protein R3Y23_06200 [Bacillota bacterium]